MNQNYKNFIEKKETRNYLPFLRKVLKSQLEFLKENLPKAITPTQVSTILRAIEEYQKLIKILEKKPIKTKQN